MAITFLKKGSESHAAHAQAEAEAKARKDAASSPYTNRFWLPDGKETQITFLDGGLTPEGLLDCVSYKEHQLKLNNNWRNWFVCIEEHEPCPICETGDYSSLVSAFTVIDHTSFTDSQGHVRQHERRLFVCKRDTFKLLQKKATKFGGLEGVTFDVSRIGDKAPNVGSDFDYVEKHTLAEIRKKYGLKTDGDEDKKIGLPYKYADIIPYRSAEELQKLGFGEVPVVGAEDSHAQIAGESKGKTPNYNEDL